MSSFDEIRKEAILNKSFVENALEPSSSKVLIYVNKSLYRGPFTMDCRKGMGWLGGLTDSMELPNVDKDSEVRVVFLSWGRMRDFEYKESSLKGNHGTPMCWSMKKLPEDE